MIKDEDQGIRLLAADNNARWCEAVCRAHGLDVSLGEHLWTSPRRTPPYYPDAVTLRPQVPEAEVLTWIDTDGPGCSVKDSFADLDLAPDGFEVLFDAQWIHRPADAPAVLPAPADEPGLDWS
ncbi:hypothetical protein ACWGDE_28610, partial [Streptomyces sp. NPDC054956]